MGAILASQALNTIGNLLLAPLFLTHWTITVYGEWMALSAVVAYVSAADLGMNAAAGNKMLAAYAMEDWETYRAVQASAIVFYVVLAGIITLVCGCVCAGLPIAVWLGVKAIPATTAAGVAWLLAVRMMWQMPVGQIANVYRTTGNLAASQWIYNAQAAASIVVTAIVVSLGGSVLSVAIWSILPLAAAAGVAWWSISRWRSDLLPHLRYARLSELMNLLRPSLLFGLLMFAIALSVQGPVLLVSALLGGGAVAVLVTTRTLTFVVRQAVAIVTAAICPELTRLDAIGAGTALRFGHRVLAVSSVAISCAFAGALWWEGPAVIRIWTIGKIPADETLLRVFLVLLVLQAPWTASAAFATATNRHRRLAYFWTGSAVIALTSCALLMRQLGILAVPISLIIGESLACYHFVIEDTCRTVGENYRTFALRLWPSLLLIFSSSLVFGWLGHAAAIGPAPVRWLEVGVFTTVAATASAWVFGVAATDRLVLTRRHLPILYEVLSSVWQKNFLRQKCESR